MSGHTKSLRPKFLELVERAQGSAQFQPVVLIFTLPKPEEPLWMRNRLVKVAHRVAMQTTSGH